MSKVGLKEQEWKRIREFLRREARVYIGNEKQCRLFVEAVLWVNRSGAQWRLLPSE